MNLANLKPHELKIAIQILHETGEYDDCINDLMKNAEFPTGKLENATLETFDFSKNMCNRVAYDAITDYIQNTEPSRTTGLFLSGNPGVGKNHLIIAAQKVATNQGIPNYYMKFTTLCHEIRSQFRDEISDRKVFRKCWKTTHLSIHDLGVGDMSPFVSGYFFDLVDHRMDAGLLTHFTTNCTEDELKRAVGDRIMDRLKAMCHAYVLTGESYRGQL